MTTPQFTRLWQVQEPTELYRTDNPPLTTKNATVLTAGYPPLKSDTGTGAWRTVPWINLRGFWLEQAGFHVGATYAIDAYEGLLVFSVEK